ncbi:MAG: diguanylate cyclase [Nitrospirae bacterium]|nr:diguanylate cyclase [Nitrospirota bacterium]
MIGQASSDYVLSVPEAVFTQQPVTYRAPSLFIAGSASFQRKHVWTSLEASGNAVHRFAGPEALVSEIGATAPDAILCEVTAAPEPVFTLLDRLASLGSDACVVLIGPEIGADLVARCLRSGAFDYLTAPAATPRVLEALRKGLVNRQAFQAVRDLSAELAQVNATLADERDVLRQWNQNLSQLNQLTQALAGSLNSEAIAQSLFSGLACLVPVDVMGFGRPDAHGVWTWSRSAADKPQEQRVRQHLLSRFSSPAAPVSQAGALVLRLPGELPLFGEAPLSCEHSLSSGRSVLTIPLTIHHQMEELALRDGLTGLLNRRAFGEVLSREFKAGTRYRASACLIMVDVDFFKSVNDLLGHVAGDDVLKSVASFMQQAVRDTDSVGRYGGEEFGVVLPHTDLNCAAVLAERIRARIERHEFETAGGRVKVTVSVGIAQIPEKAIRTVSHWIAAADAALYTAKDSGRNRVVIHTADRCSPVEPVEA